MRRDLRLYDNRTLARAGELGAVHAVFVFDRQILDHLEDADDRRVTYIYQSLQEVAEEIAKRGGKLIVTYGDPIEEIPRLAKGLNAGAVVAGEDWEDYAVKRDESVQARLKELGIGFELVKDHVILRGDQVLSESGTPYRVFTPFERAWHKALASVDLVEANSTAVSFAPPSSQTGINDWPLEKMGFRSNPADWIEPGANAARARLHGFASKVSDYGKLRDFPAIGHTSGLSTALRFGTISVRECFREAFLRRETGGKWLSELIWREFYSSILWHFPKVVEATFQPEYDAIRWPGEDHLFAAWCEGRTGYPFVDAAMRCLTQTGWMHNRLRMVTASFLAKDLLVDWRKGEAFFARFLMDFELASNNGGWQWAASVGADAQPYFRIFNPYLQSKKFDPQGEFIRQWCPELAMLDSNAIHCPHEASPMVLGLAGVELGKTYTRPIVDHGVQREKAIALLAEARDASKV